MANQRQLDLLLKITTEGAEALGKIQQQIQAIGNVQLNFGGSLDSIRQLASEFQKLNQTAEENKAAKEGAKVAAESAKAAQQVAKATAEQEKAAQQAAKAEAERQKVQQQTIVVEQQKQKVLLETARVEAERARATDIAARAAERAAKEQARLQREQEAANKGSNGGVFGGIGASAMALAGGPIPAIAFAFNQVTQAVQTVTAAVQPFFESTIGAAEKLNAQLLSSQTNLASSTRIFKDGVEITGATDKIKASEESLRGALKQIEKDTQSLVGVTSQEVNELFQITLTNAADLNNQSKQFPGPIEAATSLTKGWAASLKVVGLPLNQARQEINSIVKGQIDQNSVLAKNLNLTNEQVNKYKSQGRLVDELNKRLEVFVAGNAIASKTIEGQSSNILDIVQIFGRELGQPLVEPIVAGLSKVFELLNTNSEALIGFGKSIGQTLADGLGQVGTLIGGAIPAITQSVQQTFTTLSASVNDFVQNVAPGLTQAFQAIAPVIGGTFQVLGSVLKNIFTVITTSLAPIGQIIGATFGAIARIIEPSVQAFLALTDAFSGVIDASTALSTSSGIQFLVGGLAAGLSLAINAIGDVGGAITSVLGGAIEFIAPLLGEVIKGAIGIAEALGNTLQFFEPLLRLVGALGAGLAALAKGQAIAYLQKLGSIVQLLTGLIGKLASVVGAALKPAFDLVGAAIGNVAKTINDTIGAVGNFQKEIVTKVVSTVEGLINNPAFQAVAKTLGFDTAAIQAGLNALKSGVNGVGDKAKEAGDKGKEAGEKIGEGAKKGSSDLQFQARELEKLGTSYEQLEKQAANAQRQIENEGSGDPERFKKSAEELIKVTQQQLELGQISEAEATKRLSAIANNSKLEVGIQQNAQNAIAKAKKAALDLEKQGFQQQQSEIQELLNNGSISEAEAAKRTTAVKAEELNKQLEATTKAIEAEQAAIAKGTGSKTKLKELQTQEQQQQAELAKVAKEGRDRENQQALQDFDEQQKILEGRKARGLVGEQQFADESLKITLARLDKEQALINEKRDKLSPGDKEGLEELAAKEAELSVKRVQAEEQFQQRKLAILERAQKKATDAIRASEIARDTETNKLLAAREIRQVEADLRGVESKKKTIAAELALEKQRTAALEKLPKLNDPAKEAERQEKIRASRIKTAELTDQLVRNEIQAQEAVFRVISDRLDRQAQAAKNASEGQVQPLQAQLQLQDALGKSLDNQNKLLESRKSLQSALNGFAEGTLGLLQKSSASEKDQQTAALLAAAQKFAALQQQQQLEQQTLDIQLKQNAAALEREKIQNRIALIQNQADQAQAEADLAKAQADPNAKLNPAAVRAAELNLQAKQAAGIGLQLQGAELDDRARVEEQVAADQRQSQQLTQRTQTQQARSTLIEALPDDGAKQEARFRLQQEVLSGSGFGATSLGDINTDRIKQAAITGRGDLGLPGVLNPIAAQSNFTASPQVQALQQQLSGLIQKQTAIAPVNANSGNSPQLQATLDKLNAAIESSQLRPVQANVTNNIQSPNASEVVDLATRRMTDQLIGVLERAK